MTRNPNLDSTRRLFHVAEAQQGLFTASQAVEAGFDKRNHAYHVRAGNWERVYRGIYRLAHFPISFESHYVEWSLWSCNRKGVPQGVYSHETALAIHGLSDLNPSKLHMTVPESFRRSSALPKTVFLHKGTVRKEDMEARQGYRVTKPLRAVLDLLAEERVERTFLVQAVREGLTRGMITKGDIARAKLAVGQREQLNQLMKAAE